MSTDHANRYTCRECDNKFTGLSDAILCCAPHPEGAIAVVDAEGVTYGG